MNLNNRFILSAIFWLLVAIYREDANMEAFAYPLAIGNYVVYVATQFVEWWEGR